MPPAEFSIVSSFPEPPPLSEQLQALNRLLDHLTRWTALAEAGITVSVCCGPSGATPFAWSVDAMNRDGRAFDRPYAADNLQHAIEIARTEVKRRGWLAAGRRLSAIGRSI